MAQDNVTTTWRFLLNKGLSPAQAAGVIGSMQGESGPHLDPAAVNPNGGATGIAQWLGGRKTAAVLTKRLGPQLNHLWSELQGPERGALAALKAAHTPEQAAIAWQRAFERGAPFEQKYNMRATNARKVFDRLHGVGGGSASATPDDDEGSGDRTRTVTTTTPGVDNKLARLSLVQSFLEDRGSDPVGFAVQANALKDIPATTTSKTVRIPGSSSPASSGGGSASGGGGGGASTALNWVQSKLNDPGSVETGGANRGKLPSYLNQRFGFGASGGQPWCAMFTSAAVTKGGAPPSARTASVAQVRQKAQSGQGYVRGFIHPGEARPGDLVLFGNSHIAMVKSVRNGKITYIGGNQSNRVSQGTTGAGGVSIVRPKYGARR